MTRAITINYYAGARYNTPVVIGSADDQGILCRLLNQAVTPLVNGGLDNFSYDYNINIYVDGVIVYTITGFNVGIPIVLNLDEGYHRIRITGTSTVTGDDVYYDTNICDFVHPGTSHTYTRQHEWSDEWWVGSESKTVDIGYTLDEAIACSTPPFTFPPGTFISRQYQECDGFGGFQPAYGFTYPSTSPSNDYPIYNLQYFVDHCKGNINTWYGFSIPNVLVYHRLLDGNGNVLVDYSEAPDTSVLFECLAPGDYKIQQKVCILEEQSGNCCENTPATVLCCSESPTIDITLLDAKTSFNLVIDGSAPCVACNPTIDCTSVIYNTPFDIVISDIIYDGNNPNVSCTSPDPKYITVTITHLESGSVDTYTVTGTADNTHSYTPLKCGKYKVHAVPHSCCDSCFTLTKYFDAVDYSPADFTEILEHTCDSKCNCIAVGKEISIISNITIPDEYLLNCPECVPTDAPIPNPVQLITGAANGTFDGDDTTGFTILNGTVSGGMANVQDDCNGLIKMFRTNIFNMTTGNKYTLNIKTYIEKLTVKPPAVSLTVTLLDGSLNPIATVTTVTPTATNTDFGYVFTGGYTGTAYLEVSVLSPGCSSGNPTAIYYVDEIHLKEEEPVVPLQINCRGVRLNVYNEQTSELIEQTQWNPVDTMFYWTAEAHGCYIVELEYKSCCGDNLFSRRSLCTDLEYRLVSSACNTAHWSTCGESRRYKSFKIYTYNVLTKEYTTVIDTSDPAYPQIDYPEYVNIGFNTDSVYTVVLELTDFDGSVRTFSAGYIVFCKIQDCFKNVLNYVLCKDCYNDIRLQNQELIYMEYVQELQLLLRVFEALVFKYYAESRYKETIDIGMLESLGTIADYLSKIQSICNSCLSIKKGTDCGCK